MPSLFLLRTSLCMQKTHTAFLRHHPLHQVTSSESALRVAATFCRHTCPASHSVQLLSVKITFPTSVCMYVCTYIQIAIPSFCNHLTFPLDWHQKLCTHMSHFQIYSQVGRFVKGNRKNSICVHVHL